MSKPNIEELLARLQVLTIDELIKKIESGEATAAHLAVARGVLNDNNIQTTPTGGTNKLLNLVKDLPFDPEAEVA